MEPATRVHPGCNRMHHRLPPHAPRAAAARIRLPPPHARSWVVLSRGRLPPGVIISGESGGMHARLLAHPARERGRVRVCERSRERAHGGGGGWRRLPCRQPAASSHSRLRPRGGRRRGGRRSAQLPQRAREARADLGGQEARELVLQIRVEIGLEVEPSRRQWGVGRWGGRRGWLGRRGGRSAGTVTRARARAGEPTLCVVRARVGLRVRV